MCQECQSSCWSTNPAPPPAQTMFAMKCVALEGDRTFPALGKPAGLTQVIPHFLCPAVEGKPTFLGKLWVLEVSQARKEQPGMVGGVPARRRERGWSWDISKVPCSSSHAGALLERAPGTGSSSSGPLPAVWHQAALAQGSPCCWSRWQPHCTQGAHRALQQERLWCSQQWVRMEHLAELLAGRRWC